MAGRRENTKMASESEMVGGETTEMVMDLSKFEADNTRNCIIENEIPQICKNEPCCLGIDEAGRGPVLGPMVYGTCFSPLSKKEKLVEMGFADSKTLTEEKREELMKKISEAPDCLGWIIDILSPHCISTSMLRRSKYNLNELSHDTAIGLIQRALDRGAKIQEVYVDTVGDPGKYQAKLKGIFPSLDITVAKKADATYPIVSAASICAKVGRDHVVANWKFSEDIDVEDNRYGSGYPSDPATKKFLANNIDPVFGFPRFVRFSWSTAAVILEKEAVPVNWEDDDEDTNPKKKSKDSDNTPSLFSYFAHKPDHDTTKRHTYFQNRCLETVTTF